MLSNSPSIVFIDDKIDEVSEIINIYREEGYGVKYYNADLIEGDLPPENANFPNVNLVFLDLYYDSSSRLDVEKCTEWVSAIIPENSFYILVIWSRDTQSAIPVIDELIKENRSPFAHIIKQKSKYHKETENKIDFDKLHKDISDELEKLSEIKELSIWKNSIIRTTNVIIGHLSEETDAESLRKKMQKIIVGHGGTKLIGKNDETKKREVLFDGLDNVLISNAKQNRPNIGITDINKDNLYNIPDKIQTDIDTRLNSWFHFTLTSNEIDKDSIQSGLICTFKEEEDKSKYGLLDDENISKYLKHQIEAQSKPASDTVIENICIVLSRPCDIAQNKFGKNIKLISGLKIINPVRKNNEREELKAGSTKFDSIKLYDHLCFNEKEKDVAILLDFRYVFAISKELFIDRFQNVKFFNKELFSEIQVEYSSYSSRLGITQII